MKTIEVVAAVIVRGAEVFATRRGYGGFKGWWEFPGGKIEAGECPQEALMREIHEELDAEIEVGRLLDTVEWDYPDFHLRMHCFLCKLESEAIHLKEHEEARWLTAGNLGSVKWLPADKGLIPQIQNILSTMKKTDNGEDMKWKILQSEYIIRRPWLTARRDTVELPDGRVNDEYYILEYPDWVNVIAITKDGQFVMERQYRPGADRVCWEIPCGVIEKGETPLEGAMRELLEETGYGNGEWSRLMSISANPGAMTNFTHCYLATGVEKIAEPHLDANEDLQVTLFSREELEELMANDEMYHAQMAAPIYKYLLLNPKQ